MIKTHRILVVSKLQPPYTLLQTQFTSHKFLYILAERPSTQVMESSSTINKNWTLCIFSSFIGCIILLACLNHGQDNLKLSALPSIAISITTSDPTSSKKLLEPTNLIENKNPTNGEKAQCNIFEGKWVYDPEKSPVYTVGQCPFLSEQVSCQRNGRPDFEYEKWSWEAKGCNIPR